MLLIYLCKPAMAPNGCLSHCRAARAGQDRLFEGDGISKADVHSRSAKVYAGGGRSGKLNVDTSKGKAAKNKFKRHGSGKHAFKSKAKHKRRH